MQKTLVEPSAVGKKPIVTEAEISTTSPKVDELAAERAVADLLSAVGEDPAREGLRDTPSRVARAWKEILAGYQVDPRTYLKVTFASDHDDLVVVKDIPFHSMCEHHLLPFSGYAHIAYIPADGRVVGLSKLARVVDGYANRLQLQERITNQVADAIEHALNPVGTGVMIEAEHMCMSIRGVRRPDALTTTIAGRGCFAPGQPQRQELLSLLKSSRVH